MSSAPSQRWTRAGGPQWNVVLLGRRLLWRRRVAAARAWQMAARQEAAQHDDAIRRILDQGRGNE